MINLFMFRNRSETNHSTAGRFYYFTLRRRLPRELNAPFLGTGSIVINEGASGQNSRCALNNTDLKQLRLFWVEICDNDFSFSYTKILGVALCSGILSGWVETLLILVLLKMLTLLAVIIDFIEWNLKPIHNN